MKLICEVTHSAAPEILGFVFALSVYQNVISVRQGLSLLTKLFPCNLDYVHIEENW